MPNRTEAKQDCKRLSGLSVSRQKTLPFQFFHSQNKVCLGFGFVSIFAAVLTRFTKYEISLRRILVFLNLSPISWCLAVEKKAQNTCGFENCFDWLNKAIQCNSSDGK